MRHGVSKRRQQAAPIIDLGWGHTPLLSNIYNTPGVDIDLDIKNIDMNYWPYEGSKILIEDIKKMYKRVLGISLDNYKIILTEGASMALYLLGELLERKYVKNVSLPKYHYVKLPHLINAGGLRPFSLTFSDEIIFPRDSYRIVEIPSNPLGEVKKLSGPNIAVDIAYLSPPYARDAKTIAASVGLNNCHAIIASFGKMTGFNSLRLGFLALKNSEDYDTLIQSVGYKTLGPSALSQSFLMYFINNIADNFFKLAQEALGGQREQVIDFMKKKGIEILSQDRGMFVVAAFDQKIFDKLSKRVYLFSGTQFGMPPKNGTVFARINVAKTQREIEGFLKILKTL